MQPRNDTKKIEFVYNKRLRLITNSNIQRMPNKYFREDLNVSMPKMPIASSPQKLVTNRGQISSVFDTALDKAQKESYLLLTDFIHSIGNEQDILLTRLSHYFLFLELSMQKNYKINFNPPITKQEMEDDLKLILAQQNLPQDFFSKTAELSTPDPGYFTDLNTDLIKKINSLIDNKMNGKKDGLNQEKVRGLFELKITDVWQVKYLNNNNNYFTRSILAHHKFQENILNLIFDGKVEEPLNLFLSLIYNQHINWTPKNLDEILSLVYHNKIYLDEKKVPKIFIHNCSRLNGYGMIIFHLCHALGFLGETEKNKFKADKVIYLPENIQHEFLINIKKGFYSKSERNIFYLKKLMLKINWIGERNQNNFLDILLDSVILGEDKPDQKSIFQHFIYSTYMEWHPRICARLIEIIYFREWTLELEQIPQSLLYKLGEIREIEQINFQLCQGLGLLGQQAKEIFAKNMSNDSYFIRLFEDPQEKLLQLIEDGFYADGGKYGKNQNTTEIIILLLTKIRWIGEKNQTALLNSLDHSHLHYPKYSPFFILSELIYNKNVDWHPNVLKKLIRLIYSNKFTLDEKRIPARLFTQFEMIDSHEQLLFQLSLCFCYFGKQQQTHFIHNMQNENFFIHISESEQNKIIQNIYEKKYEENSINLQIVLLIMAKISWNVSQIRNLIYVLKDVYLNPAATPKIKKNCQNILLSFPRNIYYKKYYLSAFMKFFSACEKKGKIEILQKAIEKNNSLFSLSPVKEFLESLKEGNEIISKNKLFYLRDYQHQFPLNRMIKDNDISLSQNNKYQAAVELIIQAHREAEKLSGEEASFSLEDFNKQYNFSFVHICSHKRTATKHTAQEEDDEKSPDSEASFAKILIFQFKPNSKKETQEELARKFMTKVSIDGQIEASDDKILEQMLVFELTTHTYKVENKDKKIPAILAVDWKEKDAENNFPLFLKERVVDYKVRHINFADKYVKLLCELFVFNPELYNAFKAHIEELKKHYVSENTSIVPFQLKIYAALLSSQKNVEICLETFKAKLAPFLKDKSLPAISLGLETRMKLEVIVNFCLAQYFIDKDYNNNNELTPDFISKLKSNLGMIQTKRILVLGLKLGFLSGKHGLGWYGDIDGKLDNNSVVSVRKMSGQLLYYFLLEYKANRDNYLDSVSYSQIEKTAYGLLKTAECSDGLLNFAFNDLKVQQIMQEVLEGVHN